MPVLLSYLFYSLLLLTGSSIAAPACSNSTLPSLIEATTEDLAAGLEARRFTSVELVTAYFARIKEVNATLHAVIELNPDALSIAAALDAERKNGTIRGPLHGIPILIKNNIATADKMNNTAGSYALLGSQVPRDAGVAARLRKAGAVLLGKTNLSQWANYRSNNSSNGWSALGGQTYGAYIPKQDPSGSSSGSGVSSSLGLALAALGTETDGSILSPSSVNNLVGIKPSVGLTSRAFVIPISEHQDTVGPMARTVKDAAYLLQAIAGKDPDDNYTSAIPEIPDYVAACNFSAFDGARIGIPRNLIYSEQNGQPVMAAFAKAIATIRAAGSTVLDNTNVTAFAENDYLNGNTSGLILDADFFTDLPKYTSDLTKNPHNITSVASLRAFTRSFPLEDYPDRDTGVWDEVLSVGFGNTDPRFWPLYQHNLRVAGPEGILGILANNSLDALILPTDFSPGMCP
jgi:amidase